MEETVLEARLNNSRSFLKGILNSALELMAERVQSMDAKNVKYVEGHCMYVCMYVCVCVCVVCVCVVCVVCGCVCGVWVCVWCVCVRARVCV